MKEDKNRHLSVLYCTVLYLYGWSSTTPWFLTPYPTNAYWPLGDNLADVTALRRGPGVCVVCTYIRVYLLMWETEIRDRVRERRRKIWRGIYIYIKREEERDKEWERESEREGEMKRQRDRDREWERGTEREREREWEWERER